MKTHELASVLTLLAKALRAAPDIEVDASLFDRMGRSKDHIASKEGLAVNIATLAELSRINKSQWAALIEENDFPVDIRPRDASRDIMAKLTRYLEENASARERLRKSASRGTSKASPELMKALASLLEG